MAASRIVPVIMCGGAGTRLWPVSRESMPKQFVPLVGPNSTFQQVLARIGDAELFDRPIVITNTDFRFVVAEQLRECGIEADIVLEPVRRDSGPAVAVAALLGALRAPDADRAGARGRSCHPQARRVPRRLPPGRCRGGAGTDRHLRHRADASRDQLRLYPAGRSARRLRGAGGRRLRREAGRRHRRRLRRRELSLEQRQLPVSCRHHAGRDRALRARRWRRPPRRRSPACRSDLDFLRLPPSRSGARRRSRSTMR